MTDHDGEDCGGGSGDMVAGSGGHEAGGMNDGNATAAATGGSGVLIAVRFATADMSAKHTTRTDVYRPLANHAVTAVCKTNAAEYKFLRSLLTIGVGDGGQGGICPLKFGKNIFRPIIMKNSGIFRARIM